MHWAPIKYLKEADNSILCTGLRNEHEVGKRIAGVPHTIAIGDLFIGKESLSDSLDNKMDSSYDEFSLEEHHLVMERAEGVPLGNLYNGRCNKLTKGETTAMIEELREICIELFNRGVAWGDVNEGNLLVAENHSEFKLIDYGEWSIEDDQEARARKLLCGSLEVVGWILKSSYLRQDDPKASVSKELWPESTFPGIEHSTLPKQVVSFHSMDLGGDFLTEAPAWQRRIFDCVKHKNCRELEMTLTDYFDGVLSSLT